MLLFMVKVILISSSGALAPGPLTTATLALGAKHGWRSGFKVALGHAFVEFPLVLIIALGLYILFRDQTFLRISSLIGGFFMIYFGYMTIRDAFTEVRTSKFEGYPMIVGVTLTALNPFFIMWWVGIGCPLILEAITSWGLISLIPFYIAHVWLDFAWLTGLAHATSLTGKFEKFYKTVIFTLGLILLAFGINFLSYGLLEFRFLRF